MLQQHVFMNNLILRWEDEGRKKRDKGDNEHKKEIKAFFKMKNKYEAMGNVQYVFCGASGH